MNCCVVGWYHSVLPVLSDEEVESHGSERSGWSHIAQQARNLYQLPPSTNRVERQSHNVDVLRSAASQHMQSRYPPLNDRNSPLSHSNQNSSVSQDSPVQEVAHISARLLRIEDEKRELQQQLREAERKKELQKQKDLALGQFETSLRRRLLSESFHSRPLDTIVSVLIQNCFTSFVDIAALEDRELQQFFSPPLAMGEVKKLKRLCSSPGARASTSSSASTGPTADLCVGCCANEADFAFVDCGHQCVCGDCAISIFTCPICRCSCRTVQLHRSGFLR
jgi:hypothetical protein